MQKKSKGVNTANQFSSSLSDALLEKDINAFWNSWRSKFGSGKRQVSSVVDGCGSDVSSLQLIILQQYSVLSVFLIRLNDKKSTAKLLQPARPICR